MLPHFSILIATPPNYLHSRCFEEMALSLREAFAALQIDAPIITRLDEVRDRAIVLGANLLQHLQAPLPPGLILYNLEQVQKDSPWLTTGYIDLLKHYPVWDYSDRNIARLKENGVTRIALCGVGYMPGLTRIAPAAQKDIDVLFIGSTNDRRMNVLKALAAEGYKVTAAYNSYGTERDAVIARAKLVINLHYYEAQVFEIVRVSYLLANRVCVVSETGHDDALEAPLKEGVAFAPYAELVATCRQLLHNETQRLQMSQKGFDIFRTMSQVPMLERALEATFPGMLANS